MSSNEASEVFDPDPLAVSQARGFARDTLRAWGVADAEDGILLISELVTNVVQHAGTRAQVTLRLRDGTLEVGVADWHPTRVLPDSLAEGGRGLLLPTALAQTWGVTYTSITKTVWFRLPASAGATSSQSPPVLSAPPVPDSPTQRSELGRMDFAELIRHTLEAARDAVAADASYVLVVDEEGELRVRGATGISSPALLTTTPASVVLPDGTIAQASLGVPFVLDGRVIGVLGAAAAEPGRFGQASYGRLQDVADRVAMALERLRLSELERVRRGRVAFLAEASEMLSSTLDQTRASALAAQLVVPRLATWCAVYLSDPGLAPRLVYAWHADESRGDALAELLGAIPPPDPGGGRSWSLAVGSDVLLSPEADLLSRDSAWCFPLIARGRALGVVVLGRTRGDPRWPDPPSHQTFELATDLTRRVALALDNARLYERQRTTSQALQRSLLPPELPVIPGVELAAAHEAAGEANEVGGDFYDVFPVNVFADPAPESSSQLRWRFAIGDVCGTGPEAATVTGLARHTLRILAAEGRGLAEVMERLNGLILSEGPGDRFVTLLHGEITVPPAGSAGQVRVRLISAGHPLPLLLPASSGVSVTEVAKPQTLLGVMDRCEFHVQEFEMAPGDILLCVTDGVTECRDDEGALLDDDGGLARVLSECRGLPAPAVVARVRRAVEDFGSDSPSDDMAILVIRAAARVS